MTKKELIGHIFVLTDGQLNTDMMQSWRVECDGCKCRCGLDFRTQRKLRYVNVEAFGGVLYSLCVKLGAEDKSLPVGQTNHISVASEV